MNLEQCETHGTFNVVNQWGCPDCLRELRTKNKRLEEDNKYWREDIAETDRMCRDTLLKVLPEDTVEGDTMGVPGIPELIEMLIERTSRLTAERDAKEDILQRFRRYRRCEDTIANAWNALDAHDAERAEVVTTKHPSTKTKAITTNPDE